jgi:hypothetical protein
MIPIILLHAVMIWQQAQGGFSTQSPACPKGQESFMTITIDGIDPDPMSHAIHGCQLIEDKSAQPSFDVAPKHDCVSPDESFYKQLPKEMRCSPKPKHDGTNYGEVQGDWVWAGKWLVIQHSRNGNIMGEYCENKTRFLEYSQDGIGHCLKLIQ